METNVLEEKKSDTPPLGVSGLGGWLILVQIGLYTTVIMLLVQLFVFTLPSFGADIWNSLTLKDSDLYHPLWAPVLLFETAYNICFLGFCIYILFMFYGKKSILPRLMMIFYGASLMVTIVDMVLLYQIPLFREINSGDGFKDLFRATLIAAIWIPYFLKSERVKNTFIR